MNWIYLFTKINLSGSRGTSPGARPKVPVTVNWNRMRRMLGTMVPFTPTMKEGLPHCGSPFLLLAEGMQV